MRVVVVYNPASGSAVSVAMIRKKCNQNGIVIEKVISIREGYERTLQPYIEKGATILAIGGDGTISSVAQLALGTKATVAPLPGGTLNHFTKDLGIEQDLDKAIASLQYAQTHLVDVGVVNERVFINNSSIGLYPSAVRERRRFENYTGKWLGTIIASVMAFVQFHSYTVTIKGETFRTPFVFIGNNTYTLDPAVTLRPRINEGILSLFIIKNASRFSLLKVALFALIGREKIANEFEMHKVKEVTIKAARRRIHVAHDGEIDMFNTPLTYHIEAKKLRVLA
ncbi:MAG TPA: diacylglycerol kinase family protein [Candidatus Saccharimonadales bacterium]|nr:diacylglycerol kinase family protein [Candidatus Saccharimonadales bacterium]